MHRRLVFAAMAVLLFVGAMQGSPHSNGLSAQAAEKVRPSGTGPITVTALMNVADLERSADYYTRIVGLKEVRRILLGDRGYEVILSIDGTANSSHVTLISLKDRKDPVAHGSAFDRIAFLVGSAAEVDARTKAAADEGYKIVIPAQTVVTKDEKGGQVTYRYSHFKDPDGYTVELNHMSTGK
jgi:catechol 2,3-dioxygenase-like lactoylglutathione lyase family enzyme